MTSKSGLSGEGGVVSQGRRALLPRSPETLATGTTPLAAGAAADPASAIMVQVRSTFFFRQAIVVASAQW